MPYENQHSARVIDPSRFENNSFRSKDIAPGVRIITGKLKGSNSMTTQTYRFDASKFTADEVRNWLKEHKVKHIGFESAMKKAKNIEKKVIEYLTNHPKPRDEKDFHKFAETVAKDHSIAEEEVYKILGSFLSGGKSKGKKIDVDSDELAMGIKVEMEHTNNKILAEKIARDHLSEFADYYTNLKEMEKKMKTPMKKAFIRIADNLFIKMNKAGGERAGHKYIKRLPKKGKKGYIYFYTKEQFKEYQKTGKIPEQHKETSGVLAGIMAFFGFKDYGKAKEKVKAEYNKHKEQFKGVSQSVFVSHLNEYLLHKDKWDARLSGDKKITGGRKKTGITEKKKTISGGEKESSKFNISIMRSIAEIYGGVKKEEKEPAKKEIIKEENEEKKTVADLISDRYDIMNDYAEEENDEKKTALKNKLTEFDKEYPGIKERINNPSQYKDKGEEYDVEKHGGKKKEPTAEEIKAANERIGGERAKDQYAGWKGSEKKKEEKKEGKLDSIKTITVYQLSKWKDGTVTWTGSKKINEDEFTDKERFGEDGDTLWTTIKPDDVDMDKETGKIKNWSKYRILQDKEEKKGFDSNAPEKFSKDYEDYAENVKADIKKNKDIADYYLEHLQKDIKQSGQKIKSIKKESQGKNITGAIAVFEKRIKDASILSKQIKEIVGEYKKEKSESKTPLAEATEKLEAKVGEEETKEKKFEDKSLEEQIAELEKKYEKESISKLKEMMENDKRKNHHQAMKNILKKKEAEANEKEKTPVKELTKEDYPEKIKSGKIMITKENIKGGFEIFDEKFFIAKGVFGNWTAFELKSGARVGGGKTIKEAMADSQHILKQQGAKNVKNAIEKNITAAKEIKESQPMNKAISLLKSELAKAKAVPVGTVSKSGKYKKTADGQWTAIKHIKKGGEEEKEKPKSKKPEEKPKSKQPEKKKPEQGKLTDEHKGKIRNALKKVANILAQALSGRDPVAPTGAAMEETGENVEEKSRLKKKLAMQKPVNKPKDTQLK